MLLRIIHQTVFKRLVAASQRGLSGSIPTQPCGIRVARSGPGTGYITPVPTLSTASIIPPTPDTHSFIHLTPTLYYTCK
jgi:hypothetical protein